MAGSIDDEIRGVQWFPLPYSHAAGYDAVAETTIVAAADVVPEPLEKFCDRWHVPQGYSDYKEMIAKEQPDIVSVATRASERAEILTYVAEHGVKGIYAEKALACSLAEADAVKEVCLRNNVAFNYGPMRRYDAPHRTMARLAVEGAIGQVDNVVLMCRSPLLHGHSHTIDTALSLLGDPDWEYATGTIDEPDYDPKAKRFNKDPITWGTIHLKSGQEVHIIPAAGHVDWTVTGSQGTLYMWNNGKEWGMRKMEKVGNLNLMETVPFPEFIHQGWSVAIINDLIRGIETGQPTLGNVTVAHRGMEIAIAMAQSHLNGGRRISPQELDRQIYVHSR